MTNLNKLSKAELMDLINAYDAYIIAAADSGRLKTGWTPVCISEFYGCEYQDIWRAGQNFDYMYDYEEQEMQAINGLLVSFYGARISLEKGQLMCQFDGEEQKRFVRSNIQEICDGDAFFIGTGLHYADGNAHQNKDEPDEPWILYDEYGDCWFEEDIGDPKACIEAILIAQQTKALSKMPLDNMIKGAQKSASQQMVEPTPKSQPERQ